MDMKKMKYTSKDAQIVKRYLPSQLQYISITMLEKPHA